MSTIELANIFLREYPDLGDIYGIQLLKNLHYMYVNIYYNNIKQETVLTNPNYGGTDDHSGGSFYTTVHALKLYHTWLSSNPPAYDRS